VESRSVGHPSNTKRQRTKTLVDYCVNVPKKLPTRPHVPLLVLFYSAYHLCCHHRIANAPDELARHAQLKPRRPKTLTDIFQSRARLVSLRAISGPRSRPVATTLVKAAQIAFATFGFSPRQEVHLLHPPTTKRQGLSTQSRCFPTSAIAAHFRPPRQNSKNLPTLARRSQ
jgi:hypothetical protein